jgi:beta-galactosidase
MAFTNCHEAELFINGKSFGKKQSDSVHSCLWWYVPYVPGEVRAAAKGPDNTTLTAVLKTVSEPVTILLKPDATTLKADNHDIAIVEVQLLDKKNSRAVLADNLITFDVSGEGKIIGVDNGDASSLDNYKLSQRKAYAGRCIVIVQTTGKSGTIRLTAKSQGLPDASAELLSE